MTDNTRLNVGNGGDIISTDDIAGVKVQRVKVQHGADGSATDVSTASPLPTALYSAAGVGLKSDDLGYLITADFFHEVSDGNVTGHSMVRKFGHNIDVGLSVETVWSGGGLYTFPTSAETLELISSDAQDTVTTGTGARTVILFGLDASCNEISETVNMNGTGGVTTSAAFLRLHRAYVVLVGSNESNVGNITIDNTSSSQVLGLIEANEGQTENGFFTIPAGKTGFIIGVIPTVTRKQSGAAEFNLFIREDGEAWRDRATYNASGGGGSVAVGLIAPIRVESQGDIEARCIATATNTRCAIEFTILLADN